MAKRTKVATGLVLVGVLLLGAIGWGVSKLMKGTSTSKGGGKSADELEAQGDGTVTYEEPTTSWWDTYKKNATDAWQAVTGWGEA